ncbi:hypothetical protein FIU91_02445 [Roseivivax sp. THAF30]|nr:hypothetical protein FIU91_02445 [Roseivivax sp. THAF30]
MCETTKTNLHATRSESPFRPALPPLVRAAAKGGSVSKTLKCPLK